MCTITSDHHTITIHGKLRRSLGLADYHNGKSGRMSISRFTRKGLKLKKVNEHGF